MMTVRTSEGTHEQPVPLNLRNRSGPQSGPDLQVSSNRFEGRSLIRRANGY